MSEAPASAPHGTDDQPAGGGGSDDPATEPASETGSERQRRAHRRARRRRRPTGPRWRRALVEWGTIAAIAVVLAIVIRSFVFQAFFIPSGSMQPTLKIGDRILVEKLFFSASSLHSGDIVVFSRPPAASCAIDESDLVKRVIGLPGETISSRGSTVFIDGKALAEKFLPQGTAPGPAITNHTIYGEALPKVIPPGEYFVMGDNRGDSCDSRYWGYVSAKEILGRVVLDWWSGGRPAFHIF